LSANSGETEDRLKKIAKKIEQLESQLRKERRLTAELARELSIVKEVVQTSSEIAGTSRRIALVSASLRSGEVARRIVETLIEMGPKNVSQLTETLRQVAGRASRRTVSKKLEELSRRGIVRQSKGKKSEKLYELEDE